MDIKKHCAKCLHFIAKYEDLLRNRKAIKRLIVPCVPELWLLDVDSADVKITPPACEGA